MAQAFNHIRIPQEAVLDYWNESLAKIYSRVPRWMYVKTSGKKRKKKAAAWPDEKAVSVYLQRAGMSRRDLEDAVSIFGQDALEPVKVVERLMME